LQETAKRQTASTATANVAASRSRPQLIYANQRCFCRI
jgi:hypothetical protein